MLVVNRRRGEAVQIGDGLVTVEEIRDRQARLNVQLDEATFRFAGPHGCVTRVGDVEIYILDVKGSANVDIGIKAPMSKAILRVGASTEKNRQ